jgi:hypothetical protein
MTAPRPWTPEEDALVRATAGRPRAEVAVMLGRTRHQVAWRRAYLGCAGPAAKRWTTAEEWRLMELVERAWPFGRIAQAMGRSVPSVRKRCSRLGLHLMDLGAEVPLARVARMLGVEPKVVHRWVRAKWLPARRTQVRIGSGRLTLVARSDVFAFVADPRWLHLVEPARITDPSLRLWAAEARAGVRFVDTAEAGRRLGYTAPSVANLCRTGRLPGVRRGRTWVVREDLLAVPERAKPRPKSRPLTDADRALIRRLWLREPVVAIAARLGVGRRHVSAAADALGLPRPGQGYWRRARTRALLGTATAPRCNAQRRVMARQGGEVA